MEKKTTKLYIDIEQAHLNNASSFGFIGTDETGSPLNFIWAGKFLQPMPVSNKKEEAYEILADEHDVHFIFDDNVPQISFYPAPALYIFAYDSLGGYFSSTNMAVDTTEKDAPIYYIDKALKVYKLSPNLSGLLEMAASLTSWKTKPELTSEDITIFPSFEAAKKELQFYDVTDIMGKL